MIRDIWFSLPVWLQALCLGLVCVWFIQLLFLFIIRMRPLWQARDKRRNEAEPADWPAISVIVYSHNQADELRRNLPVLLDCNYPDFEVIVVDDASCDETEDVLKQMNQRSEHFFHTTMAERISTVSRRKLAMLLGVKAAHNDIIVMTQAQCEPASPDWLRAIGRQFTGRVDAVMGPVVYKNHAGWGNRFCQWDFFDRMLTMMGLTLAVKTYGGWSYNLAFRKEAFFANRNYALQHHLDIHPGEDDLFLANITRRRNVAVACSADAVVVNDLREVGYNWKRERLRRAFTSRYYFLLPCLLKRLDALTRWLTVAAAVAVIAVTAWMQSWWVMGAAALLLVLHALAYVLIPYYTAKKWGVHRYRLLPLVGSLTTPLLDLFFRVMARTSTRQFYVGRI